MNDYPVTELLRRSGSRYTVTLLSPAAAICSCRKGLRGDRCKHIDQARARLGAEASCAACGHLERRHRGRSCTSCDPFGLFPEAGEPETDTRHEFTALEVAA